jgi:hypothetical protein
MVILKFKLMSYVICMVTLREDTQKQKFQSIFLRARHLLKLPPEAGQGGLGGGGEAGQGGVTVGAMGSSSSSGSF